jgi:hypothetical protein
MRKKWIYIFTLFCLANSLFCFYTGVALQSSIGQPLVADSRTHADKNTLLDILIGQSQDDEEENDKAPYKALWRITYTLTRGTALNVQAPLQAAFAFFRLPVTRHIFGNNLIRKPILPSYYNFLFRLSPF